MVLVYRKVGGFMNVARTADLAVQRQAEVVNVRQPALAGRVHMVTPSLRTDDRPSGWRIAYFAVQHEPPRLQRLDQGRKAILPESQVQSAVFATLVCVTDWDWVSVLMLD